MGNKNKSLDNRKLLFSYFPGKSVFHKLNPISKLVFLLLLTIITLIVRSLLFMIFIFTFVFFLALISGISLKNLGYKLRFIFTILVASVILNIFFNAIPSEEEIILFYLFNLEFLPIRRLALYFALKAFLTVLILFTSSIIFTNTTSMKDFVYALMRLRIPYRYCFALMVGFRYIPLIEHEAKTISLAQKARGFGYEKVNTIKKAYTFIFERLITTLVSILRKGYNTSISMESRCFGIYKTRTNLIETKFRPLDIMFITICLSLFLGIILYLLKIFTIPQFPSLYIIFQKIFN